MLTQEQKDRLEPLTHHPKFGWLLQEAIKGWNMINPKQEQYGIRYNSTSSTFELMTDHSGEGCCLLGAAMLLKNSDTDYVLDSVFRTFSDITEDEASGLMSGFDGDEVLYEDEAYEFGKEINKILFT